MLTHYWKKNEESGEFDALPVDEAATGWAWRHQEQVAIPDIEREQRFPSIVPLLRTTAYDHTPPFPSARLHAVLEHWAWVREFPRSWITKTWNSSLAWR